MSRPWARKNVRPTAALVLAAAFLLWTPAPVEAGWDGTQAVQLGDKIGAEFRDVPLAEVHTYAFFAPKGTLLSTVIQAAADSDGLVPELVLFTSDDQLVPMQGTQVGNRVRKFRFAATGNYHFRVRAVAGTGEYTIRTTVAFPTGFNRVTSDGSFAFDAPYGTRLKASVAAANGSTVKPIIAGLNHTGGAVDLGALAGKASFSNFRLALDGGYTLVFGTRNPGDTPGAVRVRITLTPRRTRTWGFGISEIPEPPPPPPPEEPPTGLANENREKWLVSPHNDRLDEPFAHFDEDPVISTSCAKCHSTPGYRDFLGADGTQAGVVDNPAPTGTTIECDACHNDQAAALTEVTFPSGLKATGLGKEARCMVCHQGRESTVSLEGVIKAAAAADDDTISSKITFKNIHYYAAGASLYGREAAGAYEYAQPGGDASDLYLTTLTQRMPYDRKFTHVAEKDTCIECHDPHSQQVRITDCARCHVNSLGQPVATKLDLRDIRMNGTVPDFDGDGNAAEGLNYEITGLQDVLLAAIKDYGAKVTGTPVVYDPNASSYWYIQGTTTKYASWTARMVRAAYNYQYSQKDPGAFAHNGKYIVQILYDSIADLNGKLSTLAVPSPVPNFANLVRNDPGHFDSAAEAYRHWDEDTDHLVDPSCSRCHSEEGFEFVVKYGLEQTVPAQLASGLSCESCHVAGTSFAPQATNPNADKMPERIYVASVAFPFPSTATSAQIAAVTIANGAKGSAQQDDSFICMTCHRARESKLTLDAADPAGTTTAFTLSFKNSHYLGAGASIYGSKAAVMYQYSGFTYAQRWDHDNGYFTTYPAPASAKAQCKFCHMQNDRHSFEVEFTTMAKEGAESCEYCHTNSTSIDTLTPAHRLEDDYDNDSTTKPKAELAVFQARLLATIQSYCLNNPNALKTGTGGYDYRWVAYGEGYPYFVKDTNQNGVADAGETGSVKFDTKAFRATFNYNFSVKEHGSWAHNPRYVLQALYDSIKDLGGDAAVAGLKRP